ncbi:aminoglycoside phosphotransferase family protein [Litorimonas sp. RW-G-Af-16]|uniref:aminoglycoside phosphotransferase family protein n=1 Tax=Litorimonas sp. RW-G-Af-16 TaxID=3241168 RepID=UPI003AAF5C95
MSDREAQIEAFLAQAGWAKASRTPVPGDASTRRYERLTLNGTAAVLMDAPKGAEAPSEPEGASIEDRRALGYNALARLAGPNIEAFACIAHALSQRGFSAPQIYAADMEAGLMLLEDFGQDVYAKVIAQDAADERPLYEAAVDTLAAIYRSTFPQVLSYRDTTWRVRDYDEAALLAETDLCLDWFAKDFGKSFEGDARSEFYALYADSFQYLEAHADGLCLRDFHAENLFWLPVRDGISNVGLIDFQDGLFVHPAYDLMSLITDIRRDVSRDLKDHLIARFCDRAGIKDDVDFRAAYAVLSDTARNEIARLSSARRSEIWKAAIPGIAPAREASFN